MADKKQGENRPWTLKPSPGMDCRSMMDAWWTPWSWGLFTGMARICEINLISGTHDPSHLSP